MIQPSRRPRYSFSIASFDGHCTDYATHLARPLLIILICNSPAGMESQARASAVSDEPPHQRTKSSVLKSIIPGNYRRKPSSKSNDQPYRNDDSDGKEDYMYRGNRSVLPPDHPHTRQYLREDSGNRNTTLGSPKKSIDTRKEKEKTSKKQVEKEEENKMKKSKSSTSISAILSRPRSSKGAKAEDTRLQKDKENQTPPSSAGVAPPPIWAQFATQGFEKPSYTTKIPLNDQFAVEEEVALYTPRDYSPTKRRDIHGFQQPALSQRAELRPRPKSECIASGPTSTSFAETISGLRKHGRNKSQIDISNRPQQPGQATDASGKVSAEHKFLSGRPSREEDCNVSNDSAASDLPMSRGGSRVMAAVAAFNGKAKELPKEPFKETETVHLDPKAIESAFESLLVSQ